MSVTLLYLDTNQWNYLIRPPDHADDDGEALRRALVTEVDAGGLSVIGSYPLIREIVRAVDCQPARYRAMRDLAFETIQHRWIPPIGIRYKREACAGGHLVGQARYLNRKDRRDLQRQSGAHDIARQVAEETRTMVGEFKQAEEGARRRVLAKLAPAEGGALRLCREWWGQVDILDWVKDVLDSDVVDLVGEDGYLSEQVPSAWLFVAYSLARIKFNVVEGRRINDSDGFDREHFAACAYADVLVTDDKALRETVAQADELLGGLSFTVETFADLRARLGT